MKNIIQNTLLIAALFVANVAISQPNADDAGGGADPTDTAAPIDSNLVFLAIIGIIFCYYHFNKKVKTV